MSQEFFNNWAEVLAASEVPPRQQQSFAISIRWYLSFCRRARSSVDHDSARAFIAWAQEEKHPPAWRLESWKEAIRWFFRAAKVAAGTIPDRPAAAHAVSQSPPPNPKAGPAPAPDQGAPEMVPAWKTAFLTVIRRRQYSYRTEQSYLVWLERFARFCGTEDLRQRGTEDIKAFLNGLALDRRLSASSQRQALNAVVFLLREVFGQELGDFSDYRRGRIDTRAPSWLTRRETEAILDQLEGEGWWALMTRVAFGGGLRLMELLRLRVKDVDLEQEIITVRAGKGNQDRFVPLAHVTVEPLRTHLAQIRRLYEADRRQQVAGVWLPEGLARKYPKAGEEWPWFWLWPDDHLSNDPRGGVKRRHHVSDRLFQIRLKEAAKRAELNKRVTPHVLRHSFASQLLDRGTDVRTVQELLGHKSLETTMIYLHAMRQKGVGVRSPLDL